MVDLTPTARRYITFGTVSVMVNADISKIALTASKIYIVLVNNSIVLISEFFACSIDFLPNLLLFITRED